jgi:hypothetical protein
MGLRKLFAERADQRRRAIERRVHDIEASRTAPFQSILEDGETIMQYTPARDRGGTLYYLAATPRRLLWYLEDTSEAEAIPYQAIQAFGCDPKRRLVFVRHLQSAPLSTEDPYEDEMWELFPSPLSDQVLEAIVTGMRQAGRLEPAVAAFVAMSERDPM